MPDHPLLFTAVPVAARYITLRRYACACLYTELRLAMPALTLRRTMLRYTMATWCIALLCKTAAMQFSHCRQLALLRYAFSALARRCVGIQCPMPCQAPNRSTRASLNFTGPHHRVTTCAFNVVSCLAKPLPSLGMPCSEMPVRSQLCSQCQCATELSMPLRSATLLSMPLRCTTGFTVASALHCRDLPCHCATPSMLLNAAAESDWVMQYRRDTLP